MKKIAIRYGLMMLSGFIAFFLLMHIFGLSTHFQLRFFNGFIHLGAIYLAIRQYTIVKDSNQFNYLAEVAVGMYTSFFGVVGFTVFMFLFLSATPSFVTEVQAINPSIGEHLTPFTTSLYIFVEGIVVSLIGSYILARIIEMELIKTKM